MRPVLLRSFGSAKSTERLGMTWRRWCGKHAGTWTATAARRTGLSRRRARVSPSRGRDSTCTRPPLASAGI
eukprot:4930713-Prymnesium_polylepis.1